MESFRRDLRLGLRQLSKRPGFAFLTILTLAAGIGANTAVLSFVDAVLVRSLPYPESDRLALLWEDYSHEGMPQMATSYAGYLDWRQQSSSFSAMAARYVGDATVTLTGGEEAVNLRANLVSPSYFELLGVRPILGRVFLPAEDKVPLGHPVVVLSHGLWQGRYGADAGIVGQAIQLSGESYTVVGVLPADFRDVTTARYGTDVWLPAMMTPRFAPNAPPAVLEMRSARIFAVLGRLAPGATLEQAATEMGLVAERLRRSYPDTNKDQGLALQSLRHFFFGTAEDSVKALFLAAGFLLLIVCANLANLFLVRALAREREVSLRLALGASNRRLIQQAAAEGLALAVPGGLLGVLLAHWSLPLLLSFNPIQLPGFSRVAINPAIFGISFLLALAAGVAVSAAPSLRAASRTSLRDSLEGAGRNPSTGAARRTRAALLVAEVAIASVLLVGAGLLARSLWRLKGTDIGFDSGRLVTASLDLNSRKYEDPQRKREFARSLLEELRGVAGIQSASLWAPHQPGAAQMFTLISVEGATAQAAEGRLVPRMHLVGPGSLGNLGVRILQGREITWEDREDTFAAAVVSRTLAERAWPGQKALGRQFRRNFEPQVVYTVVGVAADVKHLGRRSQSDTGLDAYFSIIQKPFVITRILLRAQSDPLGLAPLLREAVARVDPDLALYGVSLLDEIVEQEVLQTGFTSLLGLLFAAAALFLAALGLYGTLRYAVAQRIGEFGVRMALGARTASIYSLVFRQGAAILGSGLALGLVGSLALSRWMESLLFGVESTDWAVYLASVSMLALAGALACTLPARRAVRIDPLQALREQQ